MQKFSPLFDSRAMSYIQQVLKVSRTEVVDTILFSNISAFLIAEYIQKKKLGYPCPVA
ncbi:MAG: hypothetical protein ABUT20_10140 [Bacteroidota bacterium]